MTRNADLGFRLSTDRPDCPNQRCASERPLHHDGGGPDFDWWWCPQCGREYRSTSYDPNQADLFGDAS